MVTAVCSHSLPEEEEDLYKTEYIEEWKAVFLLEFHRLVVSQLVTCDADCVWMSASDGRD